MIRRPVVIAVVAGAAVVAAAAIALRPSPRPPRVHYQRPAVAPTVDAFERGGVPLQDPNVGFAIDELSRAVMAGTSGDRAPPAVIARGPALATAWQTMVDTFTAWRTGTPKELDELRAVVRATSEQLVAAQVGFQLEIRFAKDRDDYLARVYGYRVDEVGFVVAGGTPRRVLGLRRMDGAKLARGALGLESAEMGPVVMLDPIAGYAVSDVLPVLAPGAPFPVGDGGWRAGGIGQRIARQAGEAVRRELVRALGADAEAAATIATLVAERDEIIGRWPEVPVQRTPELFSTVRAKDHGDASARVEAIEDRLVELEAERIAFRLETIVAASVRRHEAQHGVDLDRGTPLRYPKDLEELAGPADDEDGQPRIGPKFARAELAAYLSQLANDPATPHLTLWGVGTFAFQRGTSPESRAATVILLGLARQLDPSRAAGAGDRAWLASAAALCAGAGGDRLREAARALWTELYDEPPVTIVDR